MARNLPSKAIQERIIIEQTGRCAYCNASLGEQPIHWDHFIPYVYLQNNPNDNWVAACKPCNQSKKARIFSSEADLGAFCLEMVSRHGSLADGWPEGPYFANLRHSYGIA
jgi:hypothetical protein